MTTKEQIDLDVAIALNLLSYRTFTDFSPIDWYSWANCKSDNPRISYGDTDNDPIVIIDGDDIILYDPVEKVEHLFKSKYIGA